MIRAATPADAEAICGIYNHYVRETIVTFEEQPVLPAEMAERIVRVTATHPWLVEEHDGRLRGYAYASVWRPRASYRYSTEGTIYLAPDCVGRSLGTALYGDLLSLVRAAGAHTIVGALALPNPASVALHEKLGFEKAAELREVGRKFDRWIDVGYWQLMLERAKS